jgi:hypothetical protein
MVRCDRSGMASLKLNPFGRMIPWAAVVLVAVLSLVAIVRDLKRQVDGLSPVIVPGHPVELSSVTSELPAWSRSSPAYLPSSIETRYSLPLFFIWTPAVVAAARGAAGFLQRSPASRAWRTALMGALFLAACAGLSAWLAAQAPGLRAAPPNETSRSEESPRNGAVYVRSDIA